MNRISFKNGKKRPFPAKNERKLKILVENEEDFVQFMNTVRWWILHNRCGKIEINYMEGQMTINASTTWRYVDDLPDPIKKL